MPPPVNVLASIEGGEELRRALKKHEARFLEVMREALPEEAEKVKSVATVEAPRGTGTLASSAALVKSNGRTKVRVAVGFLDEKAAAVHEGIHWGHFVEGTTGFKWFEKAFARMQGGILERIVQRLRRIAGGGA